MFKRLCNICIILIFFYIICAYFLFFGIFTFNVKIVVGSIIGLVIGFIIDKILTSYIKKWKKNTSELQVNLEIAEYKRKFK